MERTSKINVTACSFNNFIKCAIGCLECPMVYRTFSLPIFRIAVISLVINQVIQGQTLIIHLDSSYHPNHEYLA